MSMQGATAFQQKVSQMLSKHQKKPVLKPNKALVLKNEVANRKLKKGEATCVTEMSVMMACWKQNNFVDALCPNEIQSFFQCVDKAQVAMRTKTEQKTVSPSGRLSPKQATTLLKRHPNRGIEV